MSNELMPRGDFTRRELLKLASLLTPGLLLMPIEASTIFQYGAPFSVDFWAPGSGDFRARIQVPAFADAVRVRIPWRRRDASPQLKGLFVHNAITGEIIDNAIAFNVNDEYGDLVFQPVPASAEYYVYYMQYVADTRPAAYSIRYLPPPLKAAPAWIERHQLQSAQISDSLDRIPQAVFQEIQARTEFDRCDPMELVATTEEVESLKRRYPSREYLLFPMERQNAIRMAQHLPLRWVEYGAADHFQGQACRGEFFTFQIGIWAVQSPIDSVAIEFKPLETKSAAQVPAEAFRCFNLGGVDWAGQSFRSAFGVSQNEVRALWIGVQIPPDAEPGNYEGTLILKPDPGREAELRLSIGVEARDLEEAGDRELWRYSRLRWLDSRIGLDGKITAPYIPLEVDQARVACLLRNVTFAESGLPSAVFANNHEVLAAPVNLILETAQGQQLPMKPIGWRTVSNSPDSLTREYTSTFGPIHCTCRFKMEFDGYINYTVQFKADEPIDLKDIRLEIPFRADIATYMMGLGKRGGLLSGSWQWKWNIQKADNSVWLGNAQAGMQCKLKGSVDTWDSVDLRANGIPDSWGNSGRGGWSITQESDRVISRAYSGQRTLQAGETVEFNFGLLPTPVKPLDPKHWDQRYYHAYVDPEIAARAGANIVNIHQGNELNPFINYPFWTVDALAAYTNQAHDLNLRVKLYYTVRELTNHVAELWALRSLGNEIYKDGPGGGSAWLEEHLITHYTPAWHQMLATGELDSAIATTGLSRWHNYYLEGLSYLLRHAEIDGLYLDGIGYDRTIMQRVRRVLDEGRPGCLIDLHSGDEFPPYGLSPANKYLEHFPYIDSVWFGEQYNYNASPDYWLVEISGIPFGLFGEMLGNDANPWRGMIYGMTTRYYASADQEDPHFIWKVWDDFGIQQAKMMGYWDKACPVRTDNKDILVTVYRREQKALIAIASWCKDPVQCQLTINWADLELEEQHSIISAPEIPGFQSGFMAKPEDKVLIEAGKGLLLILEGTNQHG